MNYKLGLANRKTLDRSNFNVQEVLKPLPRSPAEWKIFLKIVTKISRWLNWIGRGKCLQWKYTKYCGPSLEVEPHSWIICFKKRNEGTVFVFLLLDWNCLVTEANAGSFFKCK